MKKILPVSLVTVVFVLQQCFLFSSPVQASNNDIVINEIAAYESSGCEWIEIFNKGSEAVNVEGWRFWENSTNHTLTISSSSLQSDWSIEPEEYAIITQDDTRLFSTCTGYTAPAAGTVFDSSWTTLSESGERIGLRDVAGNLIEDFTYIAATDASLERIHTDVADYTSANWQERSTGNTFGRVNEPVVATPPVISDTTTIASIIINEFVSNPSSGEGEWIELYNPEDSDANLAGWTLADGAGTIASVAGTISAHGFLSIDLASSHLNNDGDVITLATAGNVTIDSVSYGAWNYGNGSDNAPAPGRGNSTARQLDGANTGHANLDFAETTRTTKSNANLIVVPVASSSSSGGSSGNIIKPSAGVSSILINELLSIPKDDAEEFVELYNQTNFSIDLGDWTIEDGSEQTTELSGTIGAHSYLLVNSPRGGLNNMGDTVGVFDPSGKEIDRMTYGVWDDGHESRHAPAPHEGQTLARVIVGQDTDNDLQDYTVTDSATPGKPNKIYKPVAATVGGQGMIVLNELFPNPQGVDTSDEWIEMRNMSSNTIALAGWSLRDDSHTIYIMTTGSLRAYEVRAYTRKDTKIALNNSGTETVELWDGNGTVVDQVSYSGTVAEDISYARADDGVWSWSVSSTKGVGNSIVHPNSPPDMQVTVLRSVTVGEPVIFDSSDTIDPDGDPMTWLWNFGDGEESIDPSPAHEFAQSGTYSVNVTVSDTFGHEVKDTIRMVVKATSRAATPKKLSVSSQKKVTTSVGAGTVSLDQVSGHTIGDRIQVSGVVAVAPGVYGTQYFYIVSPVGGVQIYMNKKNWPKLAVGDMINVVGELSSGAQGVRVKATATSNVTVLTHNNPVEPIAIVATDIDEDSVGRLVQMSGEVTDVKSGYVFVDDGTDELKVAAKTGAHITLTQLHKGDKITVTGIIGKSAGSLQLWPRSQADIALTDSVDVVSSTSTSSTAAQSAPAGVYVKATAGGLATIVAGLAMRARAGAALPLVQQFGGALVLRLRRKKKV